MVNRFGGAFGIAGLSLSLSLLLASSILRIVLLVEEATVWLAIVMHTTCHLVLLPRLLLLLSQVLLSLPSVIVP